jgi:hypothetical protein
MLSLHSFYFITILFFILLLIYITQASHPGGQNGWKYSSHPNPQSQNTLSGGPAVVVVTNEHPIQAAINVASPDVFGSFIVASLTSPAYEIQTVAPAISNANSSQLIVFELHNPVLSKITFVIVSPPVHASFALAELRLNVGAAVVVVGAAVVVVGAAVVVVAGEQDV